MMTNMILRITLGIGALAGVLAKTVNGQSSGVGGNAAGSTLALPTQTAVPFNQSCSLNTYLLNQTDLGVYCNGKQLQKHLVQEGSNTECYR